MAVSVENAYSKCERNGQLFVVEKGVKLVDFDHRTVDLHKAEYSMVDPLSNLGKAIKFNCLIKKCPRGRSKLTAYDSLKDVKHPNVVSVENFYHNKCPCFVLSSVDGTIEAWVITLGAGQIVKSTMRGNVPSPTYQKIVIETCSGLEALFRKKVFPVTITAKNIYLKIGIKDQVTAQILVSDVLQVNEPDIETQKSRLWDELRTTVIAIFNSRNSRDTDPVANRFFSSIGVMGVPQLKAYPLFWNVEKKAMYLLRIMCGDESTVSFVVRNEPKFWPARTAAGILPSPLHEMMLHDKTRPSPSNYKTTIPYDYLRICKDLIKHWSALPGHVTFELDGVHHFVERMEKWNPEIWCILYEKFQ